MVHSVQRGAALPMRSQRLRAGQPQRDINLADTGRTFFTREEPVRKLTLRLIELSRFA